MARRGAVVGVALLTLIAATTGSRSTAAEPPSLGLPLACAIGTDCFVQNYFDEDPGPGAVDYTCGPLTYDGHHGTDIRARTMAQMEGGIPVLAAAAGTVVAVRDDMNDVLVSDIGLAALKGKDAGNGVRIDDGGGWFTQYSHMMKGSVLAHVGEHVEAGQELGLMGLSGNTEFPHLDFSVDHDGHPVDPFVGDIPGYPCGGDRRPLWTAPAQASLAYIAGAPLAAGFAGKAADMHTVQTGGYDGFALKHDSKAVVFWALFFGVRSGDHIRLALDLPGGLEPIARTSGVDHDRADELRYIGRRMPEGGWPSGTYHGSAELIRNVDGTDQVIGTISAHLRLD